MPETLPIAYYFEDFVPGTVIQTAGTTLTEGEILDFALKYDPQPFHVDVEAAKHSIFGGLIASGFQTLALAFRLFSQTNVLAACSMGGPGMDECRWLKPVFPGDTLSVTVEVVEMRPSGSKPDRGSVKWRFEVRNQRAEIVLTAFITSILRRRPA